MADDDSIRVAQERILAIYSRSSGEYVAFHGISAAYGQLTVRSALLLNGGALFAMPAFFAAILGTDEARAVADAIVLAAGLYVAGIIFAALCSALAYANYQAGAFQNLTEGYSEILDVQEQHDQTTFHRNKEWRDNYRTENKRRLRFLDRFLRWTTWIAVVLGACSYVCFVAASYRAGVALLG